MDISKLDYKSPQFIKIALTLVIFGVITYLWYSMSYSVNDETISQKRSDLESLQQELQRAKMNVAKVDELWAELNRIFTQYKLIEELLPETRDVPDFLFKINLAAKQADAQLMRIDQQASQPQASGYYSADPYKIEILTTYHGLGKFLSLVANLPFTALVRDISISRSSNQKYSLAVTLTIVAHHMQSSQRILNINQLKAVSRGGGDSGRNPSAPADGKPGSAAPARSVPSERKEAAEGGKG